jgi:uncharacterized membrane protein
MSEDNKKFSDDLEDILGDAKEGVKKAADKAEEFAKEAKEKSSEFAKEARQRADEFTYEAKEVLSDGKNVAIIAHLTIIGWIIALVMNSNNKNEFSSFYIRQVLGIMLFAIVLSWIPILGWLIGFVLFVFWIMSLIYAIGGNQKEVPLIGSLIQDWFKSL